MRGKYVSEELADVFFFNELKFMISIRLNKSF